MSLRIEEKPQLPSTRVLMVTSARPGEGKTFVSVNLALVFAQEVDAEILLIDGDAHRRSLTDLFDLKPYRGLADLLSGQAPLSEVLFQTDLPSLWIMPAGRAV